MKNKIFYVIIAFVIIIGAIVVNEKGFNISLKYQSSEMIEILVKKEVNIQEVKALVSEVLENQPVNIQTVEVYKDMVAITSTKITDEQKASIVEKMNEKYSLELKAEDITVEKIPNTRLRDIVKPYILPVIISSLVILVYMAVRFYKLGILKLLVETIITPVIVEALLFSVIAIFKIPVGEYTISIALFVYLLTLLGITSDLEKKLALKKEELKQEEETEKI